jgi:hypothetical protein
VFVAINAPTEGVQRAFSLEGIHGSSSRTAKSIGPSPLPVPDDDCTIKHTGIRQYTPPNPQNKWEMSRKSQKKMAESGKKRASRVAILADDVQNSYQLAKVGRNTSNMDRLSWKRYERYREGGKIDVVLH